MHRQNWGWFLAAGLLALSACAIWLVMAYKQFEDERRNGLKTRDKDMRRIGGTADMRDRSDEAKRITLLEGDGALRRGHDAKSKGK